MLHLATFSNTLLPGLDSLVTRADMLLIAMLPLLTRLQQLVEVSDVKVLLASSITEGGRLVVVSTCIAPQLCRAVTV